MGWIFIEGVGFALFCSHFKNVPGNSQALHATALVLAAKKSRRVWRGHLWAVADEKEIQVPPI